MAVNIKQTKVVILTTDEFSIKPQKFIRWKSFEKLSTKATWYKLGGDGEIMDGPMFDYEASKLEELFQESCGFLEQMELF